MKTYKKNKVLRFLSAIILTSYSCQISFAQSLTDPGYFKGNQETRLKYSLMDDANRDHDVGEYRAGIYPGAVLIPVHLWGAAKVTGLFKVPKNTTLTTFLSYAKGPSDNALLDSVKIKRVAENKEKTFEVDLSKVIENPGVNDPILMPNDIIYLSSKKPLISSDVVQVIGVVSGILSIVLASIVISDRTR